MLRRGKDEQKYNLEIKCSIARASRFVMCGTQYAYSLMNFRSRTKATLPSAFTRRERTAGSSKYSLAVGKILRGGYYPEAPCGHARSSTVALHA